MKLSESIMFRHNFGTVISPINTQAGLRAEAFVINFSRGSGSVFCLFVTPSNERSEEVFNIINDQLSKFAERGNTDPTLLEAQFEHSVQVINEKIESLISGETNIKKIKITIGAMADKFLVLTGIGALHATFLREEKTSTFHVFDLLKSLQEGSEDSEEDNRKTNKKYFGALVTGDVKTGDVLGLTTDETLKTIEENQWKKILVTMSPAEGGSYLRHLMALKQIPGAALIFKFEELGSDREPNKNSITSIKSLRQTEEKTEKFLRGSLGLGIVPILKKIGISVFNIIKKLFKLIFQAIKDAKTKKVEKQKLNSSLQQKTENEPKKFSILDKTNKIKSQTAILNAIKYILKLIIEPILAIYTIFKPGPTNRRSTFKDLWSNLVKLDSKLINTFNRLPRISKILFVLGFVFIIIFFQSIFYLNYQKKAHAEQQFYETLTNEVRNLESQAEASLIYNDEQKAREFLIQAQTKINNLPQNSRSKRKMAANLQNEVLEKLVGLRHEISINQESLINVTDFSNVNAYNFGLSFYLQSDLTNPVIATTKYDDRILALSDSGKLETVDSSGAKTEIPITTLQGKIKDIELFGARLYALLPTMPQIYRFSRVRDGYGNASPWIKEGAESISEGRDIAIDGSLYVLKSNEILKFFSGIKEAWTPYIDPPLENATKIWTSDEVDGIYVLEPSRRRIVVLNKPGGLLAQYIFPEGTNLRDFAVAEKDKKLSILNGEQVQEITLSHLTK